MLFTSVNLFLLEKSLALSSELILTHFLLILFWFFVSRLFWVVVLFCLTLPREQQEGLPLSLPPNDETSRLVGVSLCHLLKSICIFSFLYFFNEDFEPTDGTSRLADLNLSWVHQPWICLGNQLDLWQLLIIIIWQRQKVFYSWYICVLVVGERSPTIRRLSLFNYISYSSASASSRPTFIGPERDKARKLKVAADLWWWSEIQKSLAWFHQNIIPHLFPCLDKTRNTQLNRFMFPRLVNRLIRKVLASEEIDAQARARRS